jgi:hypothetical protein
MLIRILIICNYPCAVFKLYNVVHNLKKGKCQFISFLLPTNYSYVLKSEYLIRHGGSNVEINWRR